MNAMLKPSRIATLSAAAPAAIAVLAEGRDESGNRDESSSCEQRGHFACPADVLVAVLRAEAQVIAQTVSQCVTVEHERLHAGGAESAMNFVGDGGLSRAAQAGEPENQTRMAIEAFGDRGRFGVVSHCSE